MSVPNHEGVVAQVYRTGRYFLGSHGDCGRFTEDVCKALHAIDPRFGHLRKRPGQNQYNGHAVDAVLYLADEPGQSVAVDIIASSASPDARPQWNPDIPRYSASDWYAPDGSPAPAPAPTPNPEPPSNDTITPRLQKIDAIYDVVMELKARYLR